MTRLIAKLLLLAAMLLMPLGMNPASAATGYHAMTAMNHCPGQDSGHDSRSGIAGCTMACASALPAVDFADPELVMITRQPVQRAAAERLYGLHPETATPPPKRS
jgi:hypothetical protein